ncbi:MAG: GPW/gp25 family protein [Bacteroidales bacterium]
MKKKAYLGSGWAFPPCFVKNEGIKIVSEDELIKESLTILLSTTMGERLFRFDYGCNLTQFIFSPMTLSNETLIKDTIENAIILHEPRIELERIELEIKDERAGILWVGLYYRIRATNNRNNMVYPFYFKEGTNL